MARLTDSQGRPHSGLMQNVVVAVVVDNVDPDELGRIQVKFPTLPEEPLSFWIRQISPMAGKERGIYALPEIDDEVLVLFMQGSQDVGVIIGQFWNGEDIPPKECKDGMPKPADTDTGASWSTDTFTDGSKDLAANDRRFWKSRSGHLLVFDDTDGSETVQIWDNKHTLALVFDPNEERIVLSNSKGDIHIRTKNDLYLEAGNDIKWMAGNNIEGESGMDTTAGMNFTCKADLNATLEGGVGLTAKGGATATLEGGATATVKAGMVMIN